MKDAWPVKAQALGGRHYRGRRRTSSIRTSTPTRSSTPSPTAPSCFFEGRSMDGCDQEFASYVHGTKGSAVISEPTHCAGPSAIYKGQNIDPRRPASGQSTDRAATPTRSSGTT